MHESPAPPAPEDRERKPDAEAAARAYLDLWERNLAHLAVHGPVLPPRPR